MDSGNDVPRLFAAALAAEARGDVATAIKLYRRVVAADATHADAWNNLAVVLGKQGKLAAAIACSRRAQAIAPQRAMIAANLGAHLWNDRQYDGAAEALHRALDLGDASAETWEKYGAALDSLGEGEGAVAAFDHSLELRPDNDLCRWRRAKALLANGDFARGFAEYEVRCRFDGMVMTQFPMPSWQGEPLGGKSILVHAEQGLGDTIQFCRYVPLLAERGARVVLVVQQELSRLLQGLAGASAILGRAGHAPVTDFHSPLLSLPYRLGTTERTIPAAIPYLAAPPRPSSPIPRPAGARLAVGIVWAGRPAHEFDRDRSLPLDAFLAIADLGDVALLSLQAGPRAADLAATGADALVTDVSGALTDFAETAAILEQLDLVIAVDTAVAHLAGALGKPCWILLPFWTDWRWLRRRDDSPWYPSVRLFRQTSPGDWTGVVQQVRTALAAIR